MPVYSRRPFSQYCVFITGVSDVKIEDVTSNVPGNPGRGGAGAGERPQRDAGGPIVLRPAGHQGPRLQLHQLLAPAQDTGEPPGQQVTVRR